MLILITNSKIYHTVIHFEVYQTVKSIVNHESSFPKKNNIHNGPLQLVSNVEYTIGVSSNNK